MVFAVGRLWVVLPIGPSSVTMANREGGWDWETSTFPLILAAGTSIVPVATRLLIYFLSLRRLAAGCLDVLFEDGIGLGQCLGSQSEPMRRVRAIMRARLIMESQMSDSSSKSPISWCRKVL